MLPHLSFNYPRPERNGTLQKGLSRVVSSSMPVILQRKYIDKALTPGSSLIFLKIWGGTGSVIEHKMRATLFHHLPSRWYYVPAGYLCREARAETGEKRKTES